MPPGSRPHGWPFCLAVIKLLREELPPLIVRILKSVRTELTMRRKDKGDLTTLVKIMKEKFASSAGKIIGNCNYPL